MEESNKKKFKLNRWVKLAMKLGFSGVALYFVFTNIEFEEIFEVFKRSNVILIIFALLFFTLSKLFSSFRLHKIFNNESIKISHKSNIKLYLLGMYYNLLLPGGIGGDGYKVWLLNKRDNTKVKTLIWNVLIDRVSGLVGLVSIALVFLFFVLKDIPQLSKFAIFSLIAIPLLLVAYFVFFHIFLKNYKKIYLSIVLYSLLVQGSQVICALLILRAFGCDIYTTEYLLVFLTSSIIILLPNFFGGLGARELTFLFGAKLFPLDEGTAIALSLMFYFISAFVSLFGLIYSLQPDEKLIS